MAIDFSLTDAQENVRGMVHWMAQEKIRPAALKADREHKYPDDILLELKLFGISMGGTPKEGSKSEESDDLGEVLKDKKGKKSINRVSVVGVEELAWGDPCVVLNIPGPGLGGPPVQFMGTPEQKKRFFAIFNKPDEIHYGAYGLTEPGAGSDVSAIRTSCKKDGKDWILNGVKCFITNGGKADWNVIFATVDPSKGRAGHRAFVVEKGTPGFRVGKIEEKMGLRASETAELVLEDCRVSGDNLLGGEAYYEGKEGFMGAMKTFDTTRPMVAGMAVGIGRAAFERTQDFVKENYVLSRPIARYHDIEAKLGRMQRRIDAARMLVWRAAWMADEGIPNAKEASMSKAYAPQVAQESVADCIDILGAAGVMHDAFLEKWYRDLKVYDIFEGTGQIQRIVISKRIVKDLKTF
jgi:acyl-CoA dehydrogenase